MYILLKNPNGGIHMDNGRPLPRDLKAALERASPIYNDLSSDEVGLFWLSLDDLMKNFDSYTNCKLKEGYCSSAYEIKNNDPKKNTFLFKANSIKGTHAYITLFRKNVRFFTDKNQDDFGSIKYGVSRIIIFQVNKATGRLEVLGNGFHAKQSAFAEINVDNEEFFIYVECEYFIKDNLDLTISCYSSKPLVMDYLKKETKKIREDSNKELLTSLLASFSLNNNKVDKPLELK